MAASDRFHIKAIYAIIGIFLIVFVVTYIH